MRAGARLNFAKGFPIASKGHQRISPRPTVFNTRSFYGHSKALTSQHGIASAAGADGSGVADDFYRSSDPSIVGDEAIATRRLNLFADGRGGLLAHAADVYIINQLVAMLHVMVAQPAAADLRAVFARHFSH